MFATRLTTALEQALAESPRAQALCTALAGRSLRVVVSRTPLTVTIDCDGKTLHWRDPPSGQTDVTIAGGALALLALIGDERERVVQRGAVSIEGDTAIAEQFALLAALLRPNLEHLIAGFIGRVPAHALATGAETLRNWSGQLRDNLLRTSADYMLHERREWLSQAEAGHFYGEVAALQKRVAQLHARLAQLPPAETRP